MTATHPPPLRAPGGRVVFQPPNTIGLGHISRLAAIALAIRELDSTVATLFAVEGDDHGLLTAVGLPKISIPGRDLGTDAWDSWPPADQARLATALSEAVVQAMRPDLVVFDCVPNQTLFDAARQQDVPVAICLRKMKSESLRRLLVGIREADLIVVPHTPDEMGVPAELAGRTRYVGRIVRPVTVAAEPRAPWRVVVTGGGGGYPGTVHFYNRALAALEICRRADPQLRALLVTGPLFGDWHQLRPAAGVQIVPFEADLARVFSAVDLVICQAGYNTVAEIASMGVSAICVPAHRDLDDQHERARETAARHAHFQVLLDDADPVRLAELIQQALAGARGANRPALPAVAAGAGAIAAARAVLEVVRRRRDGRPG